MVSFLMKYFLNLLIWLDQGVNVLLAGDPQETLSSRMGKAARRGDCILCYWVCVLLSKFDERHCERSIKMTEGDDELWKW